MHGGVVASAAERDVSEFTAATHGEDVRAITGGALGAVHRQGIGVVEMFDIDRKTGQHNVAASAGSCVDPIGGDGGDGELLAGDDPGVRVGCEGDDAVTDGVRATAGDSDVVAVQVAELIPLMAGE